MHIIVLGGAGAMGRVTVRTLAEYEDVDQITIADYNEERARELATALKSSKMQVAQIDVNDEERLRSLLRGSNVVLSAVDYVYNLPVLRACIAEKVHYADLGGLFHMSRKLLALHAEASAAGITAILGMGGTPGITNVLARAAVDKLDRVDSIKVQLGCGDDTPSTAPLVAPYSIRTILDEFTKQPMVFEDGSWHPQQPLSGQEEIIFPLPVGRATAIYSLHSECATFPLSFHDKGIRYVSFKIAFPTDFLTKLKFLVDLGFGSDEPINMLGGKVSPREVLARLLEMTPVEEVEPQDCDVLRIVASGAAAGQPVEITNQVIVLPYRRWGIGAGALDTGVPLAIAGHMLATGEITHRGAFGPELCVPVEPFFKELARYDMHVTETRTVVVS
ncbi:MAG TPA: saccharopine dehydrogenase NADP-binding domain-containing protein [Ktedonobacteraceae bacterium]|nr:saccharopine dehydrogenase NADP-binding domain-containing protein [Ktedonobacteraceae bacterium]